MRSFEAMMVTVISPVLYLLYPHTELLMKLCLWWQYFCWFLYFFKYCCFLLYVLLSKPSACHYGLFNWKVLVSPVTPFFSFEISFAYHQFLLWGAWKQWLKADIRQPEKRQGPISLCVLLRERPALSWQGLSFGALSELTCRRKIKKNGFNFFHLRKCAC